MEVQTHDETGARRPVLVCVSPYVPFEGIDHAGGAYLHRYLAAARAAGWQVRLVAPATHANRAASARVPDVPVALVRLPDGVLTRLRNVVADGVPAVTGRPWLRRLPEEAVEWLRTCDVVDLHFADALWNASAIREAFPAARIVGLAHDVRTQSLLRARHGSSGRARLEALVGLPAARRREPAELGRLDLLSVFKEEDRSLLRAAGVTTDVRVLPVLLPDLVAHPRPDPGSGRLLFTGAFHRPENVEAAVWMLDEVLPRIRRHVPDVQVRLAGGRPPPTLLDRRGPGVEVTGYLPDLARAYEGVACVVVPLLRGAGVKFKTVEAVRAGFPVVATTVGAEGVLAAAGAGPDAVRDDPDSFADAVVRILSAPSSARRAHRLAEPDPRTRDHFERLRRLAAPRSEAR